MITEAVLAGGLAYFFRFNPYRAYFTLWTVDACGTALLVYKMAESKQNCRYVREPLSMFKKAYKCNADGTLATAPFVTVPCLPQPWGNRSKYTVT
jgi:hypothetical protein